MNRGLTTHNLFAWSLYSHARKTASWKCATEPELLKSVDGSAFEVKNRHGKRFRVLVIEQKGQP